MRIMMPSQPISYRTTAVRLGVIAVALIFAIIHPARATPPAPAPPLTAVRSWSYWLQSYDLDRLKAMPVDMLVVDYARSDPAGGAMRPFTRQDVDLLKSGPDGRRRIALAYLSIGEAEEYRYYWNSTWREQPPAWHISENCRWPRNHLVKFWERDWKDIIYRAPGNYLDRIIEAGFDGVYVDRIDAYEDLKSRHADTRTEMIAFMVDLSARAKSKQPGFLVLAQNAEALLSSDGYRQAIDGIAKEDLLSGVGGTSVRNSPDLIAWSTTQIAKLTADGGAAFAIEYVRDADTQAAAHAELEAIGIIPTFPTRALDGANPFVRDPPEHSAVDQYGTPEYGEIKCNGVFFRTE